MRRIFADQDLEHLFAFAKALGALAARLELGCASAARGARAGFTT
jgi:hypothetical protein